MNLYVVTVDGVDGYASVAFADNVVDARTVYIADTLRITGEVTDASVVRVMGEANDGLLYELAERFGVERVHRSEGVWYFGAYTAEGERRTIRLDQ